MIDFMLTFLPNLMATIFGVIFGLPVALYVNRRVVALQQLHDEKSKALRLNNVADTLINACEYNIKILDSIRELSFKTRVMHNPDLQTTTWDAIKIVFTPICKDSKLLQQLSHHWLRLQKLERLNQEIFFREIGTLPKIEDESMMLGMWRELHESTICLSMHARELSQRLEELKK